VIGALALGGARGGTEMNNGNDVSRRGRGGLHRRSAVILSVMKDLRFALERDVLILRCQSG
jgi:hypothetical protein